MKKKIFVFLLVFSLITSLSRIIASPSITVYPGVVLYTLSGQRYVFAQAVTLQTLSYDPASDKWTLGYTTVTNTIDTGSSGYWAPDVSWLNASYVIAV
jgi:hypothetical protein